MSRQELPEYTILPETIAGGTLSSNVTRSCLKMQYMSTKDI